MPVINELPTKGGKEPVLTFVGGGWVGSTGGNRYGIGYQPFVNNEYWVTSSPSVICQKDFTALVIQMGGSNTDSSTTQRRSLYIGPDNNATDILELTWSKFGQANTVYEFKAGDRLTGWHQNNNTNSRTIGSVVIFDIS